MRTAFAIPPGIVSDDTTFITPGRWADGNNTRFWRGQPEAIGGWSSLSNTPVTGVCRNMLAWTNNEGTLNIGFGTHSALQVYIGGEFYDITPTGLAEGSIDAAPGPGYGAGPYGEEAYGTPRTLAGPRTWSLSNYGQSLIACATGETINVWNNDTVTVAQPLANAPARCTLALTVPQRQVMALGCNEEVSGEFNPLCIRFSDIENITVWTTSTGNNAGEVILEGGGRIVAYALLGIYVMVWTDNALYQGQFIGQIGQAWRFDRVAENCGAIGPNSVAIVGKTAFWISNDLQFRQWTPGASPQIIACPIRNDFKDNLQLSQREKIIATTVSIYGEVWWHYPDARDGQENSRYVALSTLDGTWFRGQMGRTAAIDAGVATAPLKVEADTGLVMYHETGTTANGAALNWFVESSDQYLGVAQENLFIRGVWPDFEFQGSTISMTVKVRQHPQGTVRERGPYTLAVGAAKRDFRATGRIAALRFEGATGGMRLGKPAFDVVTAGAR